MTTSVVILKGRFGAYLVPVLEAAVPEETFVLCGPDDAVPAGADALVTFAEGSSGIERLLTEDIRWVHALGTGVDGLPLAALADRLLTCSRGASAVPIAEWVLAVMLAFEKQLPRSWVSAPPERWSLATLGTLAGRTLGLVGLGSIGVAVARRALAFDMEVLAVRRTGAASPVAGVTVLPTLVDLVRRCDHLVIVAPGTAATERLVDRTVLAECRPGVHLVNVARGTMIDQDDLMEALDSGIVARASLDVVDPEPLPEGHPLYRHPGVRISPHISWSSPSTTDVTVQLFVDNLRRWRRGEELQGVVDTDAGY